MKAGTDLFIDFYGLHFHGAHWQRPREFLPQRFDKDDPLYLAPDGQKRHPYAWTPFSGGKRACFGKTFAEAAMKIVVTYLTSFYNLKHVEAKHRDKKTYHMAHFGMAGKRSPIPVLLTPHSGFQD